MSSDEIAIKVDSVSKNFMLPHQRANTVKGLLVNNPFKQKRKNSVEVQHALNNISFEVKKGEFFGIVGRNGSGKSTLLKMLAGIYQPTKGKIAVNGRLVPFIELGVGFNPELTGRENVYLNGALLGFSQKEVAAKYRSIVDFAELDRFMDQKLKNYSSGMQVRLAFSVATILAESDILLIDEVLAVGDADFQRKCFDYFKKLKNDNKTVVFVSHDMDAIRTYCDRAVLINDSKLVYSGRAEEVSKEYTKLFNQDRDGGSASEAGSARWGTNEARIENISIEVGPSEILITETLEARADVDGCIVGFRIANSTQEGVTGTNTKLERHPIGPLVKGERVRLCWKLPNIFSSGEYTFDTTVHSVDLATIYDWWEGGKSFKVKNSRDLPYYSVDPEFSLEVVRDNS